MFGAGEEVRALVRHRPGGDDRRAGQQAKERPAHGGLAGPGFAPDPEALAAEREGGVAHRPGDRPSWNGDLAILDDEQLFAHRDFGSKTSRRPSPRRLKPRLTMKMARPGMVATHH